MLRYRIDRFLFTLFFATVACALIGVALEQRIGDGVAIDAASAIVACAFFLIPEWTSDG